jgi:hypothetical protein
VGGLRQVVARSDLPVLATGAFLTVVAASASLRYGTTVGVGGLAVLLFFAVAVASFLFVPHIAVAATIPLFALMPAAKVLVALWIGPVKDIVTLAAGTAVFLYLIQSEGRRLAARTDKGIPLAAGLFVALYAVNLGGAVSGSAFGAPWLHGIRLVTEPIVLLMAGLLLPESRRTLRWAAASVVATGCVVAGYGVLQQLLGPSRLVSLGYSYESQVKTIGTHMRSFGSLDDAFAYAAFLLFALATVIFWMRRGPMAFLCAAVIVAGLAASLVQTAAVVVGALLALWLVRKGRAAAGLALFAALLATGLALALASATATQTQSVRAGPGTYLTLNGRTSVWSTIFGDGSKIPLGLGVGKVGRASLRSKIDVTQVSGSPNQSRAGQVAVDSGYFAAVADIGLVGLGVLLFLLGRLVMLAVRATRLSGYSAGWLGLGYLTVLLLDAITRDSFSGFPTAFLGFLLIGLTLGAARDEDRERRRVAAAV